MGVSGYLVLLIIILAIICLIKAVAPSAVILAGALFLCFVTGIITPQEAISGLSNQGVVTIALLLIMVAGIQQSGALHIVSFYFLSRRKKRSIPASLFRMMVPASFLSAFLNNTPIIVIFTPIIKRWAEWLGYASSKFLIPLSYATMFGGMCTLIGTSTNLVVHGMMLDNNLGGFSMFELAKVGIPCTLAGWLYLSFVGYKILPQRKDIFEAVQEDKKEYIVGMKVVSKSFLVGKTIQEAGLRDLKNTYLLEIERKGEVFGPVSPKERIQESDILYFVGVTSGILDIQDIPGLIPATHKMFEKDFSRIASHFVEAVVSDSSPLLGKTVKEANFRTKYSAGVIAIHRNGHRIKEKIGDIELHAGDTLLILAREEFLKNWADSRDFYLVSKIKTKEAQPLYRIYLSLTILSLMVLVVALRDLLPPIGGNKISMLYAASGAVCLMLLMRCVELKEAKNALDLNVLLTIVCALGIGKAFYNSGAAQTIAFFLIKLSRGFGPVGILGAIYLLTSLFAAIITNKAAVVLVFPIAYSAALQLGLNPHPFFIAIALAGSASFSTPIGYQTNLIVQGAGGYKFSDYLKVGLPLNVLFFIISLVLIPLFWSL